MNSALCAYCNNHTTNFYRVEEFPEQWQGETLCRTCYEAEVYLATKEEVEDEGSSPSPQDRMGEIFSILYPDDELPEDIWDI